MINLEDIKKLKLKITWKLLYVCICEEQIHTESIIKYAVEKIQEGDERIEVFELAGAYAEEKEYICDLLLQLIENEDTLLELEKRKLRVVLLAKRLGKKNDNYIDGLMELSDSWIELGYPKDSPHIIQGRGNNIAVKDYYTQEFYDFLYERNVKWLKKEIKELLDIQ